MSSALLLLLLPLLCLASMALAQEEPFNSGHFRWISSGPLIGPDRAAGDFHSLKDPSVVYFDGRWHLFCTVRGTQRSHGIVYLSFSDWSKAEEAPQQVLPCHAGYFCAPQVFYFAPQKLWYLICQASDESWSPKYRPAYATNANIADVNGWSALKPLVGVKPAAAKAWLDFWVICDDQKAFLFFTSLDGKMWRSETELGKFPGGWGEPVVALQGDIFEASHSYRIRGQTAYLTIVEAQNGKGWRYYKAYTADRLDGAWKPLAADRDHAFASMGNVLQPERRWTDVISHVELLRAGHDQRLEIDPSNLQVLYQGVLDTDRAGKQYGEIPWRLGLLRQAR